MTDQSKLTRCEWARTPLSVHYHDTEWGVPARDDAFLFEHIVLEGAQAGLSWELILQKREGYRRAFAGFDIDTVAEFTDDRIEELAQDASIVRNRQKIRSAIKNARAAQAVGREHGSLSKFIWDAAGGHTLQNEWVQLAEIPVRTEASERLSKALMARGFSFVGPVGMYSFMQAVGIVNDHLVSCPRYEEVRRMSPG